MRESVRGPPIHAGCRRGDGRIASPLPSSRPRTTTTTYPSSRPPRGPSMRIEMEVVSGGGEGSGGSGNVPSTLTSFHSSSRAFHVVPRHRRQDTTEVAQVRVPIVDILGGIMVHEAVGGRQRCGDAHIGDPIVATSSSSSSLSSDARRSDAAVVVVPPRHVWERLHPGGDDACRGNVLRWTSTDGEGECGVEVSRAMRTMSPFGRRGRGTTEARVQRQLGRRGSCPRTPRK